LLDKLQTGRSLLEYQAQAKQLFRRMNSNTPTRGSLETGPYLFQFVFISFYNYVQLNMTTSAVQCSTVDTCLCYFVSYLI